MRHRPIVPSLALAALIASIGCDPVPPSVAATAPAPTQVGVVALSARPVTLTRELPGRASAFRVAEVRARVDGIVLERLFTEGSEVAEGDPLFRIDPAPYRAALASAEAHLARARSVAGSARLLVDRYDGLIEKRAIGRQVYDDAAASLQAARADVAAARAAVDMARIDLDYATVRAPIAGRIGRAEVTEGAYVRAGEATLLATVQQLDPMYVDFTWSSAELMRLRRALDAGALVSHAEAPGVTLVLDGGAAHPGAGTLQFADATVDPTTDSISLRALFPNPDGALLPGMFARVRVEQGTRPAAYLVPQRGVVRDRRGTGTALFVTPDGAVEQRRFPVEQAHDDAWLVTDGINEGDRVIVEGQTRVRPGDTVDAVPADRPAAGR